MPIMTEKMEVRIWGQKHTQIDILQLRNLERSLNLLLRLLIAQRLRWDLAREKDL